MDKRKRHKYNDQWILEHYDPDARWSAICKQYNETFRTDIKYPTFTKTGLICCELEELLNKEGIERQ